MDETGFACAVFAKAIGMLDDPHGDRGDRRHAALIAEFAAKLFNPGEAEVAGLLRVAPSTFGDAVATEAVARALAALSVDRQRLGGAVARLARLAFEEREHHAVTCLVVRMLAIDAWRAHIREEWCAAALTWTLEDWPNRDWLAGLLVHRILAAATAVPVWLCEQVETFPALVTSRAVQRSDAWRLHVAAPTVEGWHLFARDERSDELVVDVRVFGDSLDVALETLEQAIGEAVTAQRRTQLARWLVALVGNSP